MIIGISILAVLALALAGYFVYSRYKGKAIKPYEHGYITGIAAYMGYSRIADSKDDEFRSLVAGIWRRIDAVDGTDSMVSDMADITGLLSSTALSEKLNKVEQLVLSNLADVLLKYVDGKLEKHAKGHADAILFLSGFRSGVNSARPVTVDEVKALEEAHE